MPSSDEVTQLLVGWSEGDQADLYQLSVLARGSLHRVCTGYSQQTTALVNDAYLRLINWKIVRRRMQGEREDEA